MNSIFITDSGVSKNSGGGVVSYNIIEALNECSDLQAIMANVDPKIQTTTMKIKNRDILLVNLNPAQFPYPADPPFFKDYLAYHHLPDVPIHLAVFYACPFGLTAQRLKEKGFVRIVSDIAPHSIELSREEHESYFTSMPLENRYPYPHLKDPWLWKLYSKHLRLSDAVIAHSSKGGEYIKKKAELTKDPYIIPHGNYPPLVEPDLPTDQVRVGYFGALGLDKGFHYLYKAIENTNRLFFIGGKDSMALKPTTPNVTVVGPVDDLAVFYKNINVYVQPTVTEGFGITALEAMAYGRPVIVTEWCGVADIIKDGKEGFVIPIRSPGAISQCLQYFTDNPGELKRMGREARKTGMLYSWENVKSLYREVVDRVMI